MPKCSCLGRNPECYKCGGWGWIGDTIHENRRLDDPIKFSLNKRNNDFKKKCPYCESKFTNLTQHVSVAHDDKWEHYLSESNAKVWLENNNWVRCHLCKVLVKKLSRHLSKAHSINDSD